MSEPLNRFEKHIEVTSPNVIAVDLLAGETGLSKQKIKQVMVKGAVWLTLGSKTQRLRRAKKTLSVGHVLHIYFDSKVLNTTPQKPLLINDEGQYSVWNKPYGLLSQGSKWGDHCTLTRWAEQNLLPKRPSFLVHRLDRAANGLIVIAHEKKAAAALSTLFQQRKIIKRYHIWVHREFNELATKQNPIKIDSDIDGRTAVSYFTRLKFDPVHNRSLLDVSIDTGRKHQIRIHSALQGYPIIGDRLHGYDTDKEDLQLSAYYLSFQCPYTHEQKVFDLRSQG